MTHRKRNRRSAAVALHVPHFQSDGTKLDIGIKAILIRNVATDHHAYQIRHAQPLQVARLDQAAIAQHRHAVANLKDLVQTVRNVDDRDTLRLQPLDDRKQPFNFRRSQCRRRLVQNQ